MIKLAVKTPALGTHPETELLLCCARTCIDSENVERIKALTREDIDWTYLIQAARYHRVIPLLYRSLSTACPEAVPKPILDQLQDSIQTKTRYNHFLAGELLKLLELFEEHEIPALPYKGPVLAESVYGDLALRWFADLDILINERDAQKAKALLISQGFQPDPNSQLSWQASFARGSGESKVDVDLHWRITQTKFTFPLDLEQLWERLELVSLADTPIHSLSTEDLLLIRCQDAAQDYWKPSWPKLRWICDIAELIHANQDLDWRQVMERASQLGCQGILLLCLSLASNALGTTLPEEVGQKMQADPQLSHLAKVAHERLFREISRQNNDPQHNFLERHFFCLRLKERLPLPVTLSFPILYGVAFFYYLLRPMWQDDLS